MGKLRVDSKKPTIRLEDNDYILTWPLFNLKVVFPRTGFMTGDIIPCDATPYKMLGFKNPRIDIEKLQWDVLQLVGLFSEKEIVTMVQALHPAATSKDIVAILQPGYRRIVEVVYPGGMRSGKTMAVKDSMERDREARDITADDRSSEIEDDEDDDDYGDDVDENR